MSIRNRLSTNMRTLRVARDWSQEELAFQSDLHRTYIADLERGARNPTIEVVDKLAVALNVKVGELLN